MKSGVVSLQAVAQYHKKTQENTSYKWKNQLHIFNNRGCWLNRNCKYLSGNPLWLADFAAPLMGCQLGSETQFSATLRAQFEEKPLRLITAAEMSRVVIVPLLLGETVPTYAISTCASSNFGCFLPRDSEAPLLAAANACCDWSPTAGLESPYWERPASPLSLPPSSFLPPPPPLQTSHYSAYQNS